MIRLGKVSIVDVFDQSTAQVIEENSNFDKIVLECII